MLFEWMNGVSVGPVLLEKNLSFYTCRGRSWQKKSKSITSKREEEPRAKRGMRDRHRRSNDEYLLCVGLQRGKSVFGVSC